MRRSTCLLIYLIASTRVHAFFLPAAERKIAVQNVQDERRAISSISSVVATAARYSALEWKVFGISSPKQFSTRGTADGVSLQFYGESGGGGKLDSAGTLDILWARGKVAGNADIVLKAGSGGGGGKQDDLLYRMLLEDCRNGALSGLCDLGFGLYPPTGDVGKKQRQIAAACLYNKKGQYERF